VNAGTNAGGALGASHGTPPTEIGLDPGAIADAAGIPRGDQPSDPEDKEQLKELIERILRHEKGHADGQSPAPPNSDTDPCGHARFNRDEDARLLCEKICWRKGQGKKVDRLCKFYSFLKSRVDAILRSECGANEPPVPECRDSYGHPCCP
jgi:hypothetical protein